ncbi:CubicO group peptidase (beta-lactamase class C family) [Halohasta litchfieldiae]|jgi:CubicO group peptidase (beta-lactamase class C family)|uniref:CubicO group peptidase, beta-lactamase class C family n=1 Tax=Halohasta litchfieldiae TaxID=1073996 RepID=A0A1H6W6I8_9EURY|nr:serine hydrolase domain-containing protein [Halohasta litchfieldiae]ATW87239.1 CubicO group peptidase (beta-lactamase class C family) [Halohasta litchfieldiae]SEJ08430.1 CubicO group peptidase, beta-lactamase class C family [Halohasta litchfieldiae]
MASVTNTHGEDGIEALFDRQLEVGLQHGAQLVVYDGTERVVDLAGGTTGPDGEATTPDTRHLIWSCTKPLVGTCVHQLVEDGQIAYDDPVVDHWPSFDRGDEQKQEVTVRHVLSHQTGMPTSPLDGDPAAWGDWEGIVDTMEQQELQDEPGTTAAYHTMSYGWLVGELVRQVTGTRIEEYAAENVFEPLGLDQTSVGVRDGRPETVADVAGFDIFDRCRDPTEGLVDLTPEDAAGLGNSPGVLQSVVPAANGISTARDLGKFFACMANGGALDGTRLLEPETVDKATELQIETADDGTLSRPMRYAMGYWRGGAVSDLFGTLSSPETFGHVGLGSVVAWADPTTNLTFAYVCNGIREESYEHAARVNQLADAVYQVYGN